MMARIGIIDELLRRSDESTDLQLCRRSVDLYTFLEKKNIS